MPSALAQGLSAQAGQAGAVVFAPAPVLSLPEDYFPQLRELLAAALRESPRMLLARLDLDAAAGERTQARSGLYPSVSSTVRGVFTSDIRRDLPGSTEATKTYYDVGLSQPVFHWGEKRNTARIGDIRSAIAERDYAEGYRLLAREIRQGYLDLIVLKSRLAGARFMRGQAEEALKAAEARAKVGAIAEGELFGPQIALEQATLGEGSAELAFITARDQLEALTGKPAPAEAELPDELPKIETSNAAASDGLLAEFLAEPEPSTPALETLREQVEVAQLTYKNQKTRLRPKLSFVLGVSQDEQSYTLNNAQRYGVTSRYVGLQVSWSIFDGWATRGAVRSSLARLRQAQARYAQARSTAPRAAQASARALGLAQRQMQINDRLLVASADGLRIHEADFAAGRTASDAVAQARAGYYQARASANAARLNFLMGQVDLVSQIDRDPLIENLPRP